MGSTIQEYLASLQGKRVAILGIGVSNTLFIKILLWADVRVTACDKGQKENFGGQVEELESLGAKLRLDPGCLDGPNHDMTFRTPGLRPDVPQLLAVQERRSTITSEMGVLFQVYPCKTIAVTGSDGKTTITTIIAELPETAEQGVYAGGNIGKPLLLDVDGMVPEDVAVLELSSFQLMTMERSPDIVVVTNLAPNHPNIHKSTEEHITTKENIFTHQGADSLLVLSQNNEITHGFAVSARGRTIRLNRRGELEQGVFVRDEAIWMRNAMHERLVLYLENILLLSEHNIENYMVAIGALDGLVPGQVVRDFAAEFAGVEYRIELVWARSGVCYHNGPIASSPSCTIAGLHSFHQKVAPIAGGYDKHIPFDMFGSEVAERVKALVLTGGTAPRLRQTVEQVPGYDPAVLPIAEYKDFEATVLVICGSAQPGDVVLLSPACTSLDRFKNFTERGAAFKRIIYGLE